MSLKLIVKPECESFPQLVQFAVDGQNIPVRSASKDAGGGTSGSHIAQGFLVAGGFGAIFSPGKQVGVRAGTEFVIVTKATEM